MKGLEFENPSTKDRRSPRFILDMELQSGAITTVAPGLHRMISFRVSLSTALPRKRSVSLSTMTLNVNRACSSYVRAA